MRIGILSFRKTSQRPTKEELRLQEEGRKRGHTVRILRKDKFVMLFNEEGLGLTYNKKPFKGFDVIIPRTTALHDVIIQASILEQIELMGIPVINRYYPVIRAKNKLHTLQILSAAGIPTVKTALIFTSDNLEAAIKHIKSFPLIVKTPFGSYGKGVSVFESKRSLNSTYDILSLKTSLLIQQYIKESKGKDLRIMVIGDKAVASMERKARKGDFRSNLNIGGKAKAVEVNNELKNLAIKATKAINLEISGVDIIITNQGPAIVEVNANPGLEIEEITGINIAKKMIVFAEKYVQQYIQPIENLYL